MLKILLLYIALIFLANASIVNELTSSNFDTMVRMSKDVWIVEFYSPTCPYCKEFASEYENVASGLQGTNIKVGRIDGVHNDILSGQYNIHGYPTVKMFRPGTSSPEDYNGPRKSANIIDTAKALAQDKKIRSFGDAYLNLPQTRRIPKSKRMSLVETEFY